jgi:hypothetical protein
MRLLKAILSTVILCVVTHGYNAQNTVFSKLYNFDNFRDAATAIIETKDSNFLFVGASNLNAYRNLIVKITPQGDTLWSKQYDLSIGGDNASNVVELPNGNFLLSGTLHDTATVTAKGYLMLINAQGDSLWIRQYGSGNGMNGDWTESITLVPDGGFVVAGWTVLAPNFNTFDAWVFKTDSVGNLLWQKQFDGHGLDDIFEKVIITPDGNIVCAGVTVLNSVTGKDYVVKLNQLGDTIWTKEFGGVECGGTFDINSTADGGFIGCGGKCVNGNQRANIYRLDSLGNVLWERDFARTMGANEYHSFAAVHEMPNSKFIAAGTDNDETQATVTPRIRMMVLDANGDSLWSQQYPHSTGTDHDYLFDMKPTSDGGYIMCGYVIHSSPTNNDALVIKVDSIDCMNYVNGCQSVGMEETLNFQPQTSNFIVYPNPNNGTFTIETTNIENATLEVYNVSGQLIQQAVLKSVQQTIDLSHQPKGLYLLKINTKNKIITQRMIKQ